MLPRKTILLSTVAVLLLISSIAAAADVADKSNGAAHARHRHMLTGNDPTTEQPSETTAQQSTTGTPAPPPPTTTYDYPYTPYDPKGNKYGRDRYGDDDGYGYGDDDGEYRQVGRYGNDDDEYREGGYNGERRGEYGRDYADYGPSHDDGDSMYGSLNVWIRAADDWEQRGQSRYNNKNRGKKYRKGKGRDNDDKYSRDRDYDRDDNKDRDYDGKDKYDNNNRNDYKKNDRKKRSYSRVKFPVRHFKDIRRFPQRSFPPLLSIFPWLPIFYDRITYQTFIFSPTGGIYILPPLINFYGQRFAVAQLIKWGYASLVSSGAPPPPNVNVAPLVAPAPVGGAVVGGVAAGPVAGGAVGGGAAVAPGPTYDTAKNRFNGGVRTDFPDFKPRYASTFEDKSYGGNRGVNRNTYGGDSNYGGTGRQEVYPQGGPRSGGSGGGGYN